MFGHGYGTDQRMWRFLAPTFADSHHAVLFDFLGHGAAHNGSDDDPHVTLDAYAADVLEICATLGLRDVIFVGHSVGGIIGALAATVEPGLFAGLVMIGSSARLLDDTGYIGGYTRSDIADLIDNVDSNFASWSASTAGRTSQRTARQFARATFLSDHRADVAKVSVPTLVLQYSADTVVPPAAGEYLARHVPHCRQETITAMGHFPHLSAPDQVTAAVHRFVDGQRALVQVDRNVSAARITSGRSWVTV